MGHVPLEDITRITNMAPYIKVKALYSLYYRIAFLMMTSLNGSIFRDTGLL